jgi:hypothetical protein
MPKKHVGGPKAAVMSIRMPEKTKFGLELTSRLYNDSIADIIVRAANMEMSSENGGLFVDLPGEELPVFLLPLVWHERECARIVKLAMVYPKLLKRSEQVAWAMVRDNDKYWTGRKTGRGATPSREFDQLKVDVLEADWAEVAAAAEARAAGE